MCTIRNAHTLAILKFKPQRVFLGWKRKKKFSDFDIGPVSFKAAKSGEESTCEEVRSSHKTFNFLFHPFFCLLPQYNNSCFLRQAFYNLWSLLVEQTLLSVHCTCVGVASCVPSPELDSIWCKCLRTRTKQYSVQKMRKRSRWYSSKAHLLLFAFAWGTFSMREN